jgi:hypothetical protein
MPRNTAGNVTTIGRAPQNYAALFSSFFGAIGSKYPVMIVKPLSVMYDNFPVAFVIEPYDPTAREDMQKVFEGLIAADPSTFSFVDASASPDWNGNPTSFGIFSGGTLGGGNGLQKYNLDTQKWFGDQALAPCLGTLKQCGPRITELPKLPPN